jgi:hypothetical protein
MRKALASRCRAGRIDCPRRAIELPRHRKPDLDRATPPANCFGFPADVEKKSIWLDRCRTTRIDTRIGQAAPPRLAGGSSPLPAVRRAHGRHPPDQRRPIKVGSRRKRAREARALTGRGWSGSASSCAACGPSKTYAAVRQGTISAGRTSDFADEILDGGTPPDRPALLNRSHANDFVFSKRASFILPE